MSLPQKIGFIGTGAITDAMVRGLLAKPAAVPHVMVSQRSRFPTGDRLWR